MPRFTFAVLVASPLLLFTASAHSALIQVDFENLSAVAEEQTQAGWDSQLLADGPVVGAIDIALTSEGIANGIGATIDDDSDGWESRGGLSFHQRAQVSGTSFDDLVEDFIATRDGVANITFTGLTVGGKYLLEAWHNDSYTLNAGFAAGAGSVTPSVNSGGFLLGSSAGSITNLYGAQTDGSFGISMLDFTATASTVSVSLTSSNPSGFLPISAIRFSAVPEPQAPLISLLGVLGLLGAARRRGKSLRD